VSAVFEVIVLEVEEPAIGASTCDWAMND